MSDEAFDPADHTVDEVKAYVEDHPDEAARIADAERDGKARTTLLDALDQQEPAAEGDADEPTEEMADKEDADPYYRYSGLAQPAPSDPGHPEHIEWMAEHAGGPEPDQLAEIKEQQAADAEAEDQARLEAAEARAKAPPDEQAQADAEAEVAKDAPAKAEAASG